MDQAKNLESAIANFIKRECAALQPNRLPRSYARSWNTSERDSSVVDTPNQSISGATAQSTAQEPGHDRIVGESSVCVKSTTTDVERSAALSKHYQPSAANTPSHPIPTSQGSSAEKERTPEGFESEIKLMLEHLTATNFKVALIRILTCINNSVNEDGRTLRLIATLIYESAKEERCDAKIYALLCRRIIRDTSPEFRDPQMATPDGKPIRGGLLFRRYLLNRCQREFEEDRSSLRATALGQADGTAREIVSKDKAIDGLLRADEHRKLCTQQRAGAHYAGIAFVGELFNMEILSTRVIHSIIVNLLNNAIDPSDTHIASLCKLLKTVGFKLQARPRMAEQVQLYMPRLKALAGSEHLNTRIKGLIQVSLHWANTSYPSD